jgi:hypothetical protein
VKRASIAILVVSACEREPASRSAPAPEVDATPASVIPYATPRQLERRAPRRPSLLDFGRPYRLGSFEFVVESITAGRQIGRRPFVSTASAGAKFVVVRYTVKNLGAATVRIMDPAFSIRSGSQTWTQSTDARTTLQIAERLQPFPELHPGIAHRHAVPFEVPASLTESELIVRSWGEDGESMIASVFLPIAATDTGAR